MSDSTRATSPFLGGAYDPERPAGYQDADLLQAQYEQESREAAADRARGICRHSYMLGAGRAHMTPADVEAERQRVGAFPDRPTDPIVAAGGQDAIPAGKVLCLDCGELIVDRFA